MTLDKQIQDIISKSMPEMEAKSLKEFIIQAEQDRDKLENLTRNYEALSNLVEDLRNENDELKKREVDKQVLDNDKKALEKERMTFEVGKIQQELAYEKDSNKKILNLVEIIFGNNIIKKTVQESISVPVSGGNNSGYISRENQSKTEIIEQ